MTPRVLSLIVAQISAPPSLILVYPNPEPGSFRGGAPPHATRNVLILFEASGPRGPRDFLNVTTGNRGDGPT